MPVAQRAPSRRHAVDPAAAEVLRRATVDGNVLRLPDEQLDRPLYISVNRVIERLGGKWNRANAAHIFAADVDIEAVLASALDDGAVTVTLDGFFETPTGLARELITIAGVESGHVVLEPSAGLGAIADLLSERVPAERLYLIEQHAGRHQVLAGKGYRPP